MSRRAVGCLALAALAAATLAAGASTAVRVIGGTAIPVRSAPWAVFVADVAGSQEFDCSGSVIDASHVLTAAHCLYDDSGDLTQPSSLTVVAGVSNFLSPAATDLEQDRNVDSFRVHPDYVYLDSDQPDDVAVLELATPLDLSGPAVQAVRLPPPAMRFPAGAGVAVAGFGLQDANAPDTNGSLVSMTAAVDAQGECGAATGDDTIQIDNAVVLCATSPTSSVCHGDSGGGVVTTDATPTIVGVVDAGPSGCPIGSAGLAAYVAAPEILSFIQGDDRPPTAPRPSEETTYRLTWPQPLVAGNTLTCSTDGWPAGAQMVYTFVDAASGDVLQAGPRATYLLPPKSVGTRIACEVAATGGGGTTVETTAATAAVKPPPRVTIDRLPPLTAKRGRHVTLHVVLRSPRGLSGAFVVCAALPRAVGGEACRSTREPFGAAGSFRFTLTLAIKPTARLGPAPVAIAAAAGLSKASATATLRIVEP